MKFRIWNSDEDCLEMIAPVDDKFQDQYLLTMKGQLYEWDMDNCEFIEPEYNTDYKIMFSTGLFDKNGIEIYEGDSVKETTYYEDSDGSTERIIIVTNYTEYLFNLRLEGDYWKSDLEVIGNIYEDKNEHE